MNLQTNLHSGEAAIEKKSFIVGSVAFAAVRAMFPKRHWLLLIEETGEILQAGAGGISNESVPKMKADLEELLTQVSKGDIADFRRRFELNIVIKTATGDVWELEPVKLQRMPSHDAQDWLKFMKLHIPGTTLLDREQDRLQRFMRKYGTECFSSRGGYVTFAGGMLANCDPSPFQVKVAETGDSNLSATDMM